VSLIAEQYIAGVLDGSIPAGPWIKKALQRHKRDLEKSSNTGNFYFDPNAGDFVIDFVQTFCIPSEQETPLVLTPWQHAVLYITYGWKRADGTRRFRRVYLEIAKKNGKTELVAALAIYHLIADGELSPRVFVAATTGKQANHCFKSAVAMRDKQSELKEAIGKSGKNPVHALYTDNLGRLSKMARDAASEDGALVSCAILDELHRWKTGSNLYSVLRYGGRTRKQPIMWQTTTAGASADGTSLCYSEREYGCKILDGFEVNDEIAPWIFCMDDKDNWKDPKNWIKANPSMGYLFNEETLVNEFNEAQGKPGEVGEFKRFALNIWSSEADDPAIEIAKWDACCREDITKYPDPRRLREDAIKELAGRTCFGGIDLAPKLDTSALLLLFPPTTIGEKWAVLEYFWCPKDNVQVRVKRDHVHYDTWSEQKFITLTSGNMTDVRLIADALLGISKQFNLKEIYYDAAWSSELVRMLGELDSSLHEKCVEFPQSFMRMNAPCQEFMRKVLRQEFSHSHNPVMRWQMANLRWNTQKGTGFVKPARGSKREKIDGCASLIMALACATSPDNQIKPKKKLWVVTSQ
jgi:phage terminase large subunit-like protein